ncbi:hypothetical protein M433DRAFT_164586 [Acidomyces richmondensis BFW]|nr:hypothetical protein M433DRAFT_164586 [Acidomyces richmondensis BFW]
MKFFTQYLTLIITLFFGYSNSIPTFPEERANGDYAIALSELQFAIPTASPTSPQQALSSLSSIYEASPTPQNLYAAMAEYIEAGITSDNTASVLQYISGALDGENSDTNVNPRDPDVAIYPKASPNDAPYDLTEEQLREAIYIPSTFRYGDGLQPIILVPGTGSTGYFTFAGNYIPLLQGSSIGDPVWLNIPGYLLNDAQTNAEYVAYAINYIYGISNNREVAVFGWSQGNIDTQWAFKYWPSTRNRTTDFVAFSPDYHGTILANFIALGEPLPPSVLQQEYNSNFINTLRNNGGDSAYVPTTNVYSGFYDEIVEPQQGTAASAYLQDARGVGVSNNEVQLVCPGQPAGSFYTHEGILYNALGYALAVDALSNDGPGQPSRLDLATVCSTYLTPGLDLADFSETENAILIAAVAILVYPDKTTLEPPIKGISLRLHYI